MSDDFFGLSIGPADGGPAVVVNVWDGISVERWIFTAAHELGHLVLHLRSREPLNFSEADFVPDRQARLVRQALERELMTLSRAAEIMRLDIPSMRARASSWVGEP